MHPTTGCGSISTEHKTFLDHDFRSTSVDIRGLELVLVGTRREEICPPGREKRGQGELENCRLSQEVWCVSSWSNQQNKKEEPAQVGKELQ
jgi:hypothetical protein